MQAVETSPRSRAAARGADALSVTVSWGEHRLASQVLGPSGASRFVVGPQADCDFVAPRAARVEFRRGAEGPTCTFSDGLTGDVLRNGETWLGLSDLVRQGVAEEADGRYQLSLGQGDVVRLELGALTVEALPVRAPRPVTLPLGERLDYQWLNVLLCTVLLGSMLVVRLTLDAAEGDGEPQGSPAELTRYRRVLVRPEPKPERKPALVQTDTREKKAQKVDAEAGRPKPKPTSAASKGGGPPRLAVGALFAGLGVKDVLGGGGLGGELNQAMGNVVGANDGLGGWTLRGNGTGGDVGGPLAIGRFGSRHGPPGRYASPALTKTADKDPIPWDNGEQFGCVTGAGESGCIDREMIRRVIHEHLGQVRYCYEALLTQHPAMAGKVSVRFMVSATGQVARSEVAQSTVGVPELGECVAGRVRTWAFPVARGQLYTVSYPFVFRPAGG